MNTTGELAMRWLDEAAAFSEPGPGVTRVLGSREHQSLLKTLREWYAESGADRVWLDDAGNLVGRWEGTGNNARTLLIGSHQDTVRQGGRYDGIMGVLLPLAVLHDLYQSGERPDTAVELIAFSDEEGTRFASTLVGSSAVAGNFNPELLHATDADGQTLEQALKDLGSDPGRIGAVARDPASVSGFFEVHIEQGPILESEDLPVGIVTAITGIERHQLTIEGKAGHAGTTPMHLRQDALVAAARVVEAVHQLCLGTDNLVGVVGQLNVTPGAVNVIPGSVSLSIELRSPDSDIRVASRRHLLQQIDTLIDQSGCRWQSRLTYEQGEVSCSPAVQKALDDAIQQQGLTPRYLFSGAGHDGLAMHHLTQIGMLFMRCREGLSHHPDESVRSDDLDTTAAVIDTFIRHWPA